MVRSDTQFPPCWCLFVLATTAAVATAAYPECTVTLLPSQDLDDIQAVSDAHCDKSTFTLCFTSGNYSGRVSSTTIDFGCDQTRVHVYLLGAGVNETRLDVGTTSFISMAYNEHSSLTLADFTVDSSADGRYFVSVYYMLSLTVTNIDFVANETNPLAVGVNSVGTVTLTDVTITNFGGYAVVLNGVDHGSINSLSCVGTSGTSLELYYCGRESSPYEVNNLRVTGQTGGLAAVRLSVVHMNFYGAVIYDNDARGVHSVRSTVYFEDSVIANNANDYGYECFDYGGVTAVRTVLCGNGGGFGQQAACGGTCSGVWCSLPATSDTCNSTCVAEGWCPDFVRPVYSAASAFPLCDGVCDDDENECVSGAHDCDGNATCTDSYGGYSCECSTGWWGSGVAGDCAPAGGCGCGPGANCSLTTTGYECSCPYGTSGNAYEEGCVETCLTAEFAAFFEPGECDLCVPAVSVYGRDVLQDALDATLQGATICLGPGEFYINSIHYLIRMGTKTLRGADRTLTSLALDQATKLFYTYDAHGYNMSDLSVVVTYQPATQPVIQTFTLLSPVHISRVDFVDTHAGVYIGSQTAARVHFHDVSVTTSVATTYVLFYFVQCGDIVLSRVSIFDSALTSNWAALSLFYVATGGSAVVTDLVLANLTGSTTGFQLFVAPQTTAQVALSSIVVEGGTRDTVGVQDMVDHSIVLNNTLLVDSPRNGTTFTSDGSEAAVGSDVAICSLVDKPAGGFQVECESDSGPDNQLCDVPKFDSCRTACNVTGACLSPYNAPHVSESLLSTCPICTYECGLVDCGAYAVCVDAATSACGCVTGYNATSPSEGCMDTDECASGERCGSGGYTCINTIGSFTCGPDVDECASNTTNTCGADYECVNTAGSFTCEYDECAVGNDTCNANATCINTYGSYMCACNPGYSGDGAECVAVVVTSASMTSSASSSSTSLTGTSGSTTDSDTGTNSGVSTTTGSSATSATSSSGSDTNSLPTTTTTATATATATATTATSTANTNTASTTDSTTSDGTRDDVDEGGNNNNNKTSNSPLSTNAIVAIAVAAGLVVVVLPIGVALWYTQCRGGGTGGESKTSKGGERGGSARGVSLSSHKRHHHHNHNDDDDEDGVGTSSSSYYTSEYYESESSSGKANASGSYYEST